MESSNINTPDYWNRVYRQEWERGAVTSDNYNRDYGPIHDSIIELIPDGSAVLDIACGVGLLCRKVKQRRPASAVTGVDFSQYTIDRNRERDRDLGIDYRCVDIRTGLRAIAKRYDAITMCEILEHLDEPERVLSDAVGLLKPGGLFILTCPHDDQIPDAEHVRRWGHDELFHALAPYARRITFTHFPPPYYHPWMMAHLLKDS